ALTKAQNGVEDALTAKIASEKAKAAAALEAKQAAEAQVEAAQETARAQAAASAALQAQQLQERRQTVIARLSSIYNNFVNTGLSDYGEAISAYNEGSTYTFDTYSAEAESVFKTTGDSLSAIENDYSNLESDIQDAISNLEDAALNCMKANANAVEVEAGNSTSYLTNYYHSLCIDSAEKTYSFLNSQ
ncbi:MAG TPA: hypothetical protein VFT82_00040, partial [Candidatus Paceibacterota bacterium]|nr:hypothetical protein [Candidatus Paceibacterota bacterium]